MRLKLVLFIFIFSSALAVHAVVSVPVINCPQNNSYTGISPSVSGSSNAFDSVHVYIDNVFSGIVISNASGNFSYTPGTNLSMGMHTVKAMAEELGILSAFSIPDTFYVNLGGYSGLIHGPSSVCVGAGIQLLDSVTGGTWASLNTSLATINGSGVVTSISPGTVTIVYTVSNSCTTAVSVFIITINPIPDADAVLAQEDCNATLTDVIYFNGTVPSTVFSWTNSNTTIGLATSGSGNIHSFLASNSTAVPVISSLTVTPSANGCTGSAIHFSWTILPTPLLTSSVTPAAICSNSNFIYVPQSSVTGTTVMWTRPPNSDITPPSNLDSGSVSEHLINNSLLPVAVLYNIRLEANGCITDTPIHLVVNSAPDAPHITLFPSPDNCSATFFQNYGTSAPPPSGEYFQWSASNAEIWTVSANGQNALISFPASGTATVYVSSFFTAIGCPNTDSIVQHLSPDVSQTLHVNYFSGQFVAVDNVVDFYQWGFDDATTLLSTDFFDEVDQNYFEDSPDFVNKYYYVKTKKNGCSQKTYYNTPPNITGLTSLSEESGRFQIYPNPASGFVIFEMNRSAIPGNIFVEVVDIAGRKISEEKIISLKTELDLTHLSPGFYSVVCRKNGMISNVSKLIKE